MMSETTICRLSNFSEAFFHFSKLPQLVPFLLTASMLAADGVFCQGNARYHHKLIPKFQWLHTTYVTVQCRCSWLDCDFFSGGHTETLASSIWWLLSHGALRPLHASRGWAWGWACVGETHPLQKPFSCKVTSPMYHW